VVVSNPPFRSSKSGKISPYPGRDAARHETTAGIAGFLATAKYLVKPSGRIFIIHHPSRLDELVAGAYDLKLSLLRLRMVHGKPDSPATMFLAELAKGRRSSPVVLPPLIVRTAEGDYTQEVETLMG
jgi:tRNA1Val (adenine37-N6)-methyltransferase